MIRKLIDLTLLVAFLVGGVFAWRTGQERMRLRSEHARLAKKIGDPTINDPSKAYFQALDTGEPMHFAWRVYLPAKYQQQLGGRWGGNFLSTGGKSADFIFRVGFVEEEGQLQCFFRDEQSSSKSTFGDKALADLMRGKWERIQITQLGRTDVAVLDPNQKAVLLRLTLPDELVREASTKLSENARKEYVPVLFDLTLRNKAF